MSGVVSGSEISDISTSDGGGEFKLTYNVPLSCLPSDQVIEPIVNALISEKCGNVGLKDISFDSKANEYVFLSADKTLFVAKVQANETNSDDAYNLILVRRNLDKKHFEEMCQSIEQPGFLSQCKSSFMHSAMHMIKRCLGNSQPKNYPQQKFDVPQQVKFIA